MTAFLFLLGLAGIVSLLDASAPAQARASARTSTSQRAPDSKQDPAPPVVEPRGEDPPRQAPEKLPLGKACIECHAEVSNAKHVHRPVRWGNCKLCHLQQDTLLHKFDPPKDLGAVCSECHVLPKRHSMHAPVRDGKCVSCHLVHQSDKRYLLKTTREVELCGQCHADQVGKQKKFVHGPVAAGICSLCHLPHSSTEPKLLRAPEETGCLVCHVDMVERLSPPNSVHPPVKENCAQCHDPHASNHRYQLRTEAKQLCLDCHRPMIEKLESQKIYHEALRSEEGCAFCHDVHSSPYPRLLKQPVRELCMSCHDQPIERPDGSALMGMGEKLRNSTHLHGPVNEGNCAACHDPHGSMTFSLLRDPYPKTFYAPWKAERYALCFRCHDSAAFSQPETDNLTGFRNGDRNLHFLHVNNEKKGRTCRACHDTHASNRAKHITEAVPFGTWEIPINFEITPTGGSCSPGCHAEKQYDRVNPATNALESLIPLVVTPPEKP